MEAIKDFEQLTYNLNLGAGYDGYGAMVEAVDFSDEELERVCRWSEEAYQRIRFYDTDSLEGLITCWQPGQVGPVHNYGYQQGWIKVLRGALRLEYFGVPREGLKAFNERLVEAGHSVYINDALGFHRFSNAGDEKCVALHLYFDKITRWEVFDEQTGKIREENTACDAEWEF